MRRIILVMSLSLIVIGAAVFAYARSEQRGESAANTPVQPAAPARDMAQAQPPVTDPAAAQQPGANIKPEPWADGNLFVRETGRLVAYSMSSGARRFDLPPGLLSADGKLYVALVVGMLTQFDPGTGRALEKFPVDGRWELRTLSPSGKWAALVRTPGDDEKAAWMKAKTWQTDAQIINTASGKVEHLIHLEGNFELETIAADGRSLFLVEHVPALNPEHYVIRLYDLSTDSLSPDVLRDKLAKDEVMTGLAWEGVASPDGHWLLTLYLNTTKNAAFIHTLDVSNKYPVCIDLPSDAGEFNQLKFYSLAYRRNTTAYGEKLFATNAALGVVAEVSLFDRRVTKTVKFTPNTYNTPRQYNPQAPTARSIVSNDGWKVYFTSGQDVWVYDAKAGKVEPFYLSNTPVNALALSGDDKRLYVSTTVNPVIALDTQSGAALTFPAASTSMSSK